MNILLVGATGLTGRALTEKILQEIPEVNLTLLARTADRLPLQSQRVKKVQGDAGSREVLKSVMPGQDLVYCAVSGYALPEITEQIIAVMKEHQVKRLVFTAAVGIYDDIPAATGGAMHNVNNEPAQVPNRAGADLVEASGLEYTILRPGFLQPGDERDYVMTRKGEMAKGYVTTLPSVLKVATEIIKDPTRYLYESISITRDMTK